MKNLNKKLWGEGIALQILIRFFFLSLLIIRRGTNKAAAVLNLIKVSFLAADPDALSLKSIEKNESIEIHLPSLLP